MRKRLMMTVAFAAVAAMSVRGATEVVDGVAWTYTVSYGGVSIGGGSMSSTAVPTATIGALAIPSTLGGRPVTSIGADAFYNCSRLTSVTIPASVTSIGSSAFSGCRGLMSVAIPAGVTSIGEDAFVDCSSLTSITIPAGVTSIGWYTFYNCSGLTSVTIPAKVTSIGPNAFSGCSGLTSVTIPKGVTSIGVSAFSGCSRLTSMTIPEGMTSIGASAFYGCRGLTSVTIPKGVTSIGSSVFYGCSGLTSVTISEGVTSIGESAFSGCSGLTSVTIPNGVMSIGDSAFSGCSGLVLVTLPSSMTSIGSSVFYGCSGLTSVLIPEGVTSIGSSAFSGCSGLTSVSIPASVINISVTAFSGCSGLNAFVVDAANTVYGTVDGVIYNKENTALLHCPGGRIGSVTILEGVTNIGERAFCNCSGLMSVTIPEGVTGIGPYAFCGCSGLTSVTIPEGVTSIGTYAFYNCSGLTSVTMTVGVESIGSYAFYGCSSLTAVMIPKGTVNLGSYAFQNCTSLREVKIEEGVTIIPDKCFYGCKSLECVEFPSTLEKINRVSYSSSYYDYNAFYGCGSNFKKIVFNGPPIATYGYTNLMSQCYNARIYYPREYAAQWQKALALNRFAGFTAPNTNLVEIVSTKSREDDPSVLDVVYKVKSDKPTVKVRAVAYLNGVRSFSNIIRMESLVDGTEASVSDSVTANDEHTISWKASDDLAVDLAYVKVEVLAVENDLLPLEMIRIPANGNNKAMEISWNVHSKDQVFDALLWLYADKHAGLTLRNGVLYGDNKPLLTGAEFYTTVTKQDPYDPKYTYEEWIYHADDAIGYVFKQMGFAGLLKGSELEYANKMTRLGLVAPDSYSGEKSYTYRWLDANK